jgi:S-DNA-T family DNA segregation ATPase FtsK/SpoIIIE
MVRDQAVHLESAMQQYRIEGEVVGIDSGPVITLYEVRLAPGTKVAALNAIASDLARALRAHNIRIVPNMAGKDTVGVEVPNLVKEKVRLKELMTANPDMVQKMNLPMFLGKDASGNPLIADLSTMPHMLIAGTTGSGKSVCMNSIIMSFLYTKKPNELKLVLVDPKMVEMSMFKDIPHLMCPVVTEMSKAAAILEWAVTKMDERYELLAEAGVRDVAGYNGLTWDELKDRFQPATEEEEARIPKKLPFLVFVIDELADLMMTNKEVESFIVRIAQKARAVGMHLILATQRPQANVVTGLIKSNMPCRVSFKVASGMDSRIVLDQKGAELLLGQGDMLFLSPRTSKLIRAQGTLVDDAEIRKGVRFLTTIAQQNFEPQLVQIKSPGAVSEEDGERDPLFDDAVRVVLETQRGSVSLLQRRLTIGYSRSSRLIEQMAQAGLLGEYKGSQAREVTVTLEEWEAIKAQAEADAAATVAEVDDDASRSQLSDDASEIDDEQTLALDEAVDDEEDDSAAHFQSQDDDSAMAYEEEVDEAKER